MKCRGVRINVGVWGKIFKPKSSLSFLSFLGCRFYLSFYLTIYSLQFSWKCQICLQTLFFFYFIDHPFSERHVGHHSMKLVSITAFDSYLYTFNCKSSLNFVVVCYLQLQIIVTFCCCCCCVRLVKMQLNSLLNLKRLRNR